VALVSECIRGPDLGASGLFLELFSPLGAPARLKATHYPPPQLYGRAQPFSPPSPQTLCAVGSRLWAPRGPVYGRRNRPFQEEAFDLSGALLFTSNIQVFPAPHKHSKSDDGLGLICPPAHAEALRLTGRLKSF
jgi:hypothetical protein